MRLPDDDVGRLAGRQFREARLEGFALQFDLAAGDQPEQRLARRARDRAETRRAPRDDARDGSPHLRPADPHHQFAALRFEAGLVGLRDVQGLACIFELRAGAHVGRELLVDLRLRGHPVLQKRLCAREIRPGLAERGFRLTDLAAHLGDLGVRPLQARVALRELRIERVTRQPGEHLARRHFVALLGEDGDDAQALDLGADQNLLARRERSRHRHGLDETPRGRLHHGDAGRLGLPGGAGLGTGWRCARRRKREKPRGTV